MKEGDIVERYMGTFMMMELKVTEVSDFIYCGPWKFHLESLNEVDEDMGWDGIEKFGTFIKKK